MIDQSDSPNGRVKHTIVMGKPGSGKSASLLSIIDKLRAQADDGTLNCSADETPKKGEDK